MSVRFRAFEPADLWKIDIQDRHGWAIDLLRTKPLATEAMEGPWSFTMERGGRVLACIGAYEGEVWGLLAKGLGRDMLALTRYGKAMMAAHLAVEGPLSALIDPDHEDAVRWARIGGFRHVDGWLWVLDARSV